MTPKYDDDEIITDVRLLDDSEAFISGKTSATIFMKTDAPLSKTNFKVLVKLAGTQESRYRAGLDLVMVLDVSGSMKDDNKIKNMKTATKFLIEKLSPIDRLSIVTFSDNAKRLCPLTQMKGDARSEIEHLISELTTGGATNMTKALEEAVKVIKDRKITTEREVAIMFVSDGDPDPKDQNGSQIDVQDVPVYTFGLGQDCDHQVLMNIAGRSKFGTYSTLDVGNTESSNLSFGFSQCLAGLLTIAVQDLTLTIKPIPPNSEIINVAAGHYQQAVNPSDGSITVSFGNLYCQETRHVLVDLALPELKESKAQDILECTYSYKDPATQEVFEALPIYSTISRIAFASEEEIPEVSVEHIIDKMKTSMEKDDDENYSGGANS